MVLPLVVILLAFLVEVGLVVRDQVLVIHAAREAARTAAVDPDPAVIRGAAADGSGLEGLRVTTSGREGAGSRVTVHVEYDEPGRFPFVRALTSRITLRASATMRVEEAPEPPASRSSGP